MKENHILIDIVKVLTTQIAKIEEKTVTGSRFSELTGKHWFIMEPDFLFIKII